MKGRSIHPRGEGGGGDTPCIRMISIGMIVVFFRGCNRRFIFKGCSSEIYLKK